MAVEYYPIYNTNLVCDGDLERDSCFLTDVQLGEADAIAAIRMVVSCLSILGSISIVSWAILKKQVCSPKVHPIFVLSLADTLLGILWIAGGWLWLRKAPTRVGCFAVSLPTIILECVTVNLTLVYALLAYSSIKTKKLNNLLTRDSATKDRVWHPVTNLVAYLIAWLTPMVIVMLFFGGIASQTNLVSNAESCSCFCLPVIGNVVPYVGSRDEASAVYAYGTNMLIFSYGLIVGTHYLVVFILLVIIYYKLLKYIKKMRREYENVQDTYHYGAMGSLLIHGQSKAKKRVLYFLTVFLIHGFFNFIMAYGLMIFAVVTLLRGLNVEDDPLFKTRQPPLEKLYILGLILQSSTAPLQGFLNAIVYGWTRDDFLHVMAFTNNSTANEHNQVVTKDNLELEKSAEYSGNTFKRQEARVSKRLSNSRRQGRGGKHKGARCDSGIHVSLVENEGRDDRELDPGLITSDSEQT